jgi:predicted Zn finger-like uncharacterized protein
MLITCPTCLANYDVTLGPIKPGGRKVRCAACKGVWTVEDPLQAAREASETANRIAHLIEQSNVTPPPTEASPEPQNGQSDVDALFDSPALAEAEPPSEAPLAEPPAPLDDEPLPTIRQPKQVKSWKRRKPGRNSAARAKGMSPTTATLAGVSLALVLACGLAAAGIAFRRDIVTLVPQTAFLFKAAGMPVNLRGLEVRNLISRVVIDSEVPVLVIDGEIVNVTNAPVPVPRLRLVVTGPQGREIYGWTAQVDRQSLAPRETLQFRRRLASPPAEGQSVLVRFLTPADTLAGVR